MKLIARFLMVVSLASGALSAATAYHASLNLDDDELEGLTVMDDLTFKDADHKSQTIVAKNTTLSGEHVTKLRDAEKNFQQKAIRVKEFSWSRWRLRWLFVGSLSVMIASSLITRFWPAAAEETAAAKSQNNPQQALAAIEEKLQQVRSQIDQASNAAGQEKAIVQGAGELQQTLVPAFLDTQQRLIASKGLGPAAEVLERFAACERQINRAWSAASDHATDEACLCIEQAVELIGETIARNTA